MVALCDADCVPQPGWLAAMVAAQATTHGLVAGLTLAADGRGAVGRFHDELGTLNPRVLPDGRQVVVRGSGRGRRRRGRWGEGGGAPRASAHAVTRHAAPRLTLPRPQHTPLVSILYGCTCNLSLALPPGASAMRFDPAFPAAAYEDVDLCMRARRAGVGLAYETAAVVAHDFGASSAGVFSQFRRYGAHEATARGVGVGRQWGERPAASGAWPAPQSAFHAAHPASRHPSAAVRQAPGLHVAAALVVGRGAAKQRPGGRGRRVSPAARSWPAPRRVRCRAGRRPCLRPAQLHNALFTLCFLSPPFRLCTRATAPVLELERARLLWTKISDSHFHGPPPRRFCLGTVAGKATTGAAAACRADRRLRSLPIPGFRWQALPVA